MKIKELICKYFGHKVVETEKNGRMWAITYVTKHCVRCGKDLGTFTRFHDD